MGRAFDLTDVRRGELLAAFDGLAKHAMEEHEKRFQARIRAVKDACNTLDNAASRFENAVRNAWGTMDKTASEYGTRMAQTIEESTRNLNREQPAPTFEDTEKFHDASVETINKIIKTVRR